MACDSNEEDSIYTCLSQEANTSKNALDLYEDYIISNDEKKAIDEINKVKSQLEDYKKENESLKERNLALEGDIKTVLQNMGSVWKTAHVLLRNKQTELMEAKKEHDALIFKKSLRTVSKDDLDRVVSHIAAYQPGEFATFLKILSSNAKPMKCQCSKPVKFKNLTYKTITKSVLGTRACIKNKVVYSDLGKCIDGKRLAAGKIQNANIPIECNETIAETIPTSKTVDNKQDDHKGVRDLSCNESADDKTTSHVLPLQQNNNITNDREILQTNQHFYTSNESATETPNQEHCESKTFKQPHVSPRKNVDTDYTKVNRSPLVNRNRETPDYNEVKRLPLVDRYREKSLLRAARPKFRRTLPSQSHLFNEERYRKAHSTVKGMNREKNGSRNRGSYEINGSRARFKSDRNVRNINCKRIRNKYHDGLKYRDDEDLSDRDHSRSRDRDNIDSRDKGYRNSRAIIHKNSRELHHDGSRDRKCTRSREQDHKRLKVKDNKSSRDNRESEYMGLRNRDNRNSEIMSSKDRDNRRLRENTCLNLKINQENRNSDNMECRSSTHKDKTVLRGNECLNLKRDQNNRNLEDMKNWSSRDRVTRGRDQCNRNSEDRDCRNSGDRDNRGKDQGNRNSEDMECRSSRDRDNRDKDQCNRYSEDREGRSSRNRYISGRGQDNRNSEDMERNSSWDREQDHRNSEGMGCSSSRDRDNRGTDHGDRNSEDMDGRRSRNRYSRDRGQDNRISEDKKCRSSRDRDHWNSEGMKGRISRDKDNGDRKQDHGNSEDMKCRSSRDRDNRGSFQGNRNSRDVACVNSRGKDNMGTYQDNRNSEDMESRNSRERDTRGRYQDNRNLEAMPYTPSRSKENLDSRRSNFSKPNKPDHKNSNEDICLRSIGQDKASENLRTRSLGVREYDGSTDRQTNSNNIDGTRSRYEGHLKNNQYNNTKVLKDIGTNASIDGVNNCLTNEEFKSIPENENILQNRNDLCSANFNHTDSDILKRTNGHRSTFSKIKSLGIGENATGGNNIVNEEKLVSSPNIPYKLTKIDDVYLVKRSQKVEHVKPSEKEEGELSDSKVEPVEPSEKEEGELSDSNFGCEENISIDCNSIEKYGTPLPSNNNSINTKSCNKPIFMDNRKTIEERADKQSKMLVDQTAYKCSQPHKIGTNKSMDICVNEIENVVNSSNACAQQVSNCRNVTDKRGKQAEVRKNIEEKVGKEKSKDVCGIRSDIGRNVMDVHKKQFCSPNLWTTTSTCSPITPGTPVNISASFTPTNSSLMTGEYFQKSSTPIVSLQMDKKMRSSLNPKEDSRNDTFRECSSVVNKSNENKNIHVTTLCKYSTFVTTFSEDSHTSFHNLPKSCTNPELMTSNNSINFSINDSKFNHSLPNCISESTQHGDHTMPKIKKRVPLTTLSREVTCVASDSECSQDNWHIYINAFGTRTKVANSLNENTSIKLSSPNKRSRLTAGEKESDQSISLNSSSSSSSSSSSDSSFTSSSSSSTTSNDNTCSTCNVTSNIIPDNGAGTSEVSFNQALSSSKDVSVLVTTPKKSEEMMNTKCSPIPSTDASISCTVRDILREAAEDGKVSEVAADSANVIQPSGNSSESDPLKFFKGALSRRQSVSRKSQRIAAKITSTDSEMSSLSGIWPKADKVKRSKCAASSAVTKSRQSIFKSIRKKSLDKNSPTNQTDCAQGDYLLKHKIIVNHKIIDDEIGTPETTSTLHTNTNTSNYSSCKEKSTRIPSPPATTAANRSEDKLATSAVKKDVGQVFVRKMKITKRKAQIDFSETSEAKRVRTSPNVSSLSLIYANSLDKNTKENQVQVANNGGASRPHLPTVQRVAAVRAKAERKRIAELF